MCDITDAISYAICFYTVYMSSAYRLKNTKKGGFMLEGTNEKMSIADIIDEVE